MDSATTVLCSPSPRSDGGKGCMCDDNESKNECVMHGKQLKDLIHKFVKKKPINFDSDL